MKSTARHLWHRLALCGALLSPGMVLAAPAAYVDVFYSPYNTFKASSPNPNADQDGQPERNTLRGDDDGYGIKGAVTLGSRLFINAEYTGDHYDGQDVPVDTRVRLKGFRSGLGLVLYDAGPTTYALAEYIRNDSKIDLAISGLPSTKDRNEGYGLHIGMRGERRLIGTTVQLGYVDIGDSRGLEWMVELDYRLSDWIGLFAGYRATRLHNDGNDLSLSTARAGATLYFGG
ncbi:hypothetical protein [Sinimarinibacterium sp. NLF-5-8]|uniref:hypothetical protein n=1 Tax=Sinimarinibacterium sp. NLF-5-8 TaxID=2698684 RepID=UPI00137BD943|nr:hypothetical protein [Sinimarinibacterium sp. NLF-5-8]QHS10199.1 hypothetical protein GT972_08615 [Sinimarinibacterium sp. NLF-5-8]